MAAKSDDYIIRLRADNEDLKKKLVQSRGALKSHKAFVSKTAGQTSTLMLGMFGGAAVLAGVTSAVKSLAGFEYQMDKVAAISGATAEEVKILTANALDLGARSQFTATQIGGLQEELARLGFSTGQIVKMTDSARKLAQVTGSELGPAAKVVGQQINAFGLEASDAGRVANVMAEAFSKSALDLEQFSVGMSYAAIAGKSAGYSIEEVTAMMGKLVDSGIQGSKAGTALRDIFSDLGIAGISLEDAFSQITESADKNTTAFDLVGKSSQNAIIVLAEQRAETLKLTAALSDQTKELDSQVAIMEDNLLTDFELLGSAMDGLVQEGSALIPVLRFIVQGLSDAANAASTLDLFFSGMGKNFEDFSATDILERVNRGLETESGKRVKDLLKPFLDMPVDKITGNLDKIESDFLKVFTSQGESLKDAEKLWDSYFSTITAGIENGPPSLDLILPPDLVKKSEEATKALKALNAERNALRGKKATGTADVSSIKSGGIDAPEMALSIPRFPKEGANAVLEELHAFHLELNNSMRAQTEVFNNIAEMSIESAIGAFAEGMATGGLKEAFRGLFDVIGGGLKTLGSALIAFGVSMKAFKEAFTNPAVAIGAGIAAIAAGALVQNAAQSLSGAGGGGGGGGGGGNMQRQSNININVQGDSMIRGSDIYTSYNIQQKQSGRRNGG